MFGVPQANDFETAEETVDICYKLFKEMGANIYVQDIDVAHRLTNRKQSNFAPIVVCKFTRRIAKIKVMEKKKGIKNVDLTKIISRFDSEFDGSVLDIFDHLTPKQQELLKQTKIFKRENNWAYCWVKNQAILLRRSNNSKISRIDSKKDLERLYIDGSYDPNETFPSLWTQPVV